MVYPEENPKGFDGTVKGLLDVLNPYSSPQVKVGLEVQKVFWYIKTVSPAFIAIGINAKISEKA